MARITYNNGYYEGDLNANGEEHGQGTFVWDNGDKYVGRFAYRKFSGQGTYYYASGAKYVGQWSNDLKNGKGTMYFKNGNVYEGNWVDDKENGFGRETYQWGYYEGQWKDGTWYGKGKEYHNKNGTTYEGIWNGTDNAIDVIKTLNGRSTHGKIINKDFTPDTNNGYGKDVYDNGYYEGYFKNGRRHGKGIYRWDSGSVYDGEWENDLKNGYGKMTVSWGTYEGFWKDDIRLGKGVEKNNKGEVFEGIWNDSDYACDVSYTYNGVTKYGKIQDGKFVEDNQNKTSELVLEPKNGNINNNFKKEKYDNGFYEGEFANGKRDGYGIYCWNSGSKYEGNWVNDVRKGYGKFFWTDGSYYEGDWDNDKMNGYGVYYSANGSVYRGEWLNDNKLNGKQIYSWGTYEGAWKNKTWCGYGKETINNGPTYEGVWKDSKNATNVTCTKNGVVTTGKIVDGVFQANK